MAGIFLSISLAYGKTHAEVTLCDQALDFNAVESFKAYTQVLLKENILQPQHLQKWIEEARAHKELNNPLMAVDASSAQKTHQGNLQYYLDNIAADKENYLHWVQEFLDQIEQRQTQKQATNDQTEVATMDMAFAKINGAHFKKFSMDINSFEMMKTKVTQQMWKNVMGEIPVTLTWDPKMKDYPDLPVNYISLWSALVFANKLSIQKGYEPIYDLDKIAFDGVASQGTLKPKGDVSIQALHQALVNSRFHRNTKNPGYRLPTVIEQEFVRSNRGQSQGSYFPGVHKENISEFAWFNNDSIQPIGEKLPLTIDGQLFYDLYGNACEWSESVLPLEEKKLNKLQKVFTKRNDLFNSIMANTRGGHYRSSLLDLENSSELTASINDPHPLFGFRLVRDLPQ